MQPDLLERQTAPTRHLAARRARVAVLNDRFRHHGATAVLEAALKQGTIGKIAMVSSFGAESVALLHLVALANRHTPVLFLDTRLLFVETLVYQAEVAERLGLTDVRILRADQATIARRDPYGALKFSDPDACCHLRKTSVLERALHGFDSWITGRKRYQSPSRAEIEFFELDRETGLIKLNPLAHWKPGDVAQYMEENRLPRHPLVARGYPSIGCAPCTRPVAAGADPRSGRWAGQTKTECGLHRPLKEH